MNKTRIQEGKKAYRAFENLAKRLMAVPKREIDEKQTERAIKSKPKQKK